MRRRNFSRAFCRVISQSAASPPLKATRALAQPTAVSRMRRSQRLDVSPTTFATWIGAHKEHTTFRPSGGSDENLSARANHPVDQGLSPSSLRHSPYHRSKLTLLSRNPRHQRSLASFLKKVPASCPDDLFRSDDDPKARALASAASIRRHQSPHHQLQREYGDRKRGADHSRRRQQQAPPRATAEFYPRQ